jgi:hypothetical protein
MMYPELIYYSASDWVFSITLEYIRLSFQRDRQISTTHGPISLINNR